MKVKYEVVVTKQIEVDISDELLTDEAIAEFNVKFEKNEDKDFLIKFILSNIFDEACEDIEGVGKVSYSTDTEETPITVYRSRVVDITFDEIVGE